MGPTTTPVYQSPQQSLNLTLNLLPHHCRRCHPLLLLTATPLRENHNHLRSTSTLAAAMVLNVHRQAAAWVARSKHF
jgi:hypothetical protein